MARYRKIDPRIWNDSKFRSLSHESQRLFLFLLTHPAMTMLGAMRATNSGLAEELGLTEKAFREAFQEALSKGMAKYDDKAFILWLPNFLKYNSPESPNVVKSWDSVIDLLPECELRNEVLLSAKAYISTMSEAFQEALPKAFREALPKAFPIPLSKGMPNQEQEQEQEQEQDNTATTYPSGDVVPAKPEREVQKSIEKHINEPIPYDEIVNLFNSMCVPGCVKVRILNPSRKALIRQRANDLMKHWEGEGREDLLECFRRLFNHVKNSDFLMGRTQKSGDHANWQCDLSWVLKSDNATKILEGKYE